MPRRQITIMRIKKMTISVQFKMASIAKMIKVILGSRFFTLCTKSPISQKIESTIWALFTDDDLFCIFIICIYFSRFYFSIKIYFNIIIYQIYGAE